MMEPTPGEWIVEGREIMAMNERGDLRFWATVQRGYSPEDDGTKLIQYEEAKANATIMAASKNLLAALEAIIADPIGAAANDYADARAAIAKARGMP